MEGYLHNEYNSIRRDIKQSEADIRRELAQDSGEIKRDVALTKEVVVEAIMDQTNHLNLRLADIHNNIRDTKEEAIRAACVAERTALETRYETAKLFQTQLLETVKGNALLQADILKQGSELRYDALLNKDSLYREIIKSREDAVSCCCETKEGFLKAKIDGAKGELDETRLALVGNQVVTAIVNALKVTVPITQPVPPISIG